MTLGRVRRLVLLFGLGAVAGAVLPNALAAQAPARRDTSSRRDTARTRVDTIGRKPTPAPAGKDTITVPVPAHADSVLRNDSLARGAVPLPPVPRLDTIKRALARAEAPPVLEIGEPRVYDRSQLFATGALTIADLLSRVPGLTEYSTGFLSGPTLVASMGNFRRIRLFLDGIELDPMDRRAHGDAPVNDLQIHALEEVRLERAVDELRVYARSWRVDRTDPYTRADIATGDQNSNLYRAFIGRRYDNGAALQLGAEQLNTQPDRRLPSSDGLNIMGRAAMQRGPWTLDGFIEHTSRNRAQWIGTGTFAETQDTVPGVATRRTTSYLRFSNGDPDVGRWFQVMASAHEYHGSLRQSNDLSFTTATVATQDSLTAASDSSAFTSQYLVTGGVTRGALAASAAERFRVGGHRTSHVLSGRASLTSERLSASVFAEGASYLDPSRLEGTVRVAPVGRVVAIVAATKVGGGFADRLFTESRSAVFLDEHGVFQPASRADTLDVATYRLASQTNLRGEVGVRLRDVFLSGGVLTRGTTTLIPPAEFGGVYTSAQSWRVDSAAHGRTLAARGRLWRAVNVDAWAVAWNDSGGYYRPKYQTRTELFIQTNLLDRFPAGNFGLLSSLTHEYRSSTRFPVPNAADRLASGFRTIAFKLEIRIQTATVSYQFRNLIQEKYAQVPGFNLPRQTQFYGVRWDFWN